MQFIFSDPFWPLCPFRDFLKNYMRITDEAQLAKLARLAAKNLIPVLVLLFVALWFIQRGDLFYVLPSVILFLCFFSPFSIASTSLGEERANLSAFRTFVRFVLVWFCRVLLSGKGCGFWLWHSMDFSLSFFWHRAFSSECVVCSQGSFLLESISKDVMPKEDWNELFIGKNE